MSVKYEKNIDIELRPCGFAALQEQSRIIYSGNDCIVINKTAGEISTEILREINAEAVHRLDVPVTGCVLFALTKDALVFLNNAFAKTSQIKKTYWAIVEKPLFNLPERGELLHHIETDSKTNKSFAYDVPNDLDAAPGKKSLKRVNRKLSFLNYRITGKGDNYLFLEIDLLSGRHHQIRAQLAAIGLHIKGDLKYGARRSEKNGGIRLHARSLDFPSPADKSEIISVTADPPMMDNLWRDFMLLNGINPANP